MHSGAAIENEKADQRKSEQPCSHAEIGGAGKRKHQTNRARRHHPRQEHLHRRATAPPDQHAESKKGRGLQHGGECSARGERPGNKPMVRQIFIAMRKADECGKVG